MQYKRQIIALLACGMIIAMSGTEALAQQRAVPENVVKSELQFADDAARHGLKYAFENNLDSTGMLVNGNTIINGLKAYSRAKADTTDLLSWKPAFAYINETKDFGFTTGPYLYFSDKKGKAVGSGNYFSIWKKNNEAVFKVLFDGGVIHKAVSDNHIQAMVLKDVKYVPCKLAANPQKIAPPQLFDTDLIYAHLDEQAILLRPEQPVLQGKKYYKTLQSSTKLTLIPKGNGYDKSGSLYYCFGNLSYQSDEKQTAKFPGYYVQVWQYRKGWKIIADVIQIAS